MTTISPLRPGSDGRGRPPADGSDRPWWRLLATGPETAEARAARLRLRKRLVVWSLPFVVVLALVATKLLTMVALGDEALRSYTAGNVTGTEDAAKRLGFLNLIEAHKAPFARGDARVLAGDYDGARAAFEESLALAPHRTLASACQIRVNLSLSLEKLGQAAQNAGQADQAKQYFDRMQQVVKRRAARLLRGRRAGRGGPAAAGRPAAGAGPEPATAGPAEPAEPGPAGPAERGQAAAARREDAGEPPAAPAGRRAARRRDQAAGRQALVGRPRQGAPRRRLTG